MMKNLLMASFTVLLLLGQVHAAEYFVSKDGDDANDGSSWASAFATVQQGVDTLEPGDTLTIAPGEYRQSVRREGLGSGDADTVIRAKIPGTVLLRGDVPAPPFRKLEGFRHVYVADFEGDAQAVNELDTLTVLEEVPNVEELEFVPGTFHHDREAGRLYLSTPDMVSPKERHYSISISADHGIYLRGAERVIIEGIAVTGFNANYYVDQRDHTHRGTWGIILVESKGCVVRECYAYLNGRGIATNSRSRDSGDNVIERCVAWANASRYGGSSGGLTIFSGRRDVIRDSLAYLNDHKGINIRGRTPDNEGQEFGSSLINNVAWQNNMDMRIKAGSDAQAHRAVGNVATRAIESFNSVHNLFHEGRGSGSAGLRSEDTIILSAEEALDPHREFADPDNHDYRLQPTSRFRSTGPGGMDQGPYQYAENIYYVSLEGDDTADGLSVETAWRSLDRAAEDLEPGDTLYLIPGVYEESLQLSAGKADMTEPIAIRGRSTGDIVIRGPVRIEQSHHIEIERVNFSSEVVVQDSEAVRFKNTRFTGSGVALRADDVVDLRVTHSEFTAFESAAVALHQSTDVFLRGNIFDNTEGPALRMDTADAILYSDYNSYRDAEQVWSVGDATSSFAKVQDRAAGHSQVIAPEYRVEGGVAELRNPEQFVVRGPMGRPIGVYLPQRHHADAGVLHVDGPMVHSVTATTANLQWWASQPAVFRVRWGRTPQMENSRTLVSVNAYHPIHPLQCYNTFSLRGLEPGTDYYFQLEFVRFDNGDGDAELIGLDDEAIPFTTAAYDPEPRRLYVAPDGDNSASGLSRSEAWRTINHAASEARPGDTVLIGEGVYAERVRVRTTGDADARITFRGHPGEKAVLHGSGKQLEGAFEAINKGYLDFDSLYVKDFRRGNARLGMFGFVRCIDMRVRRIFHDGRAQGVDAELITAADVDGLLVRNCVTIRGWDSIGLGSVRNVRIENNVFVRPDIRTVPIGRVAQRADVQIRNNIITDSLAVKKHVFLVREAVLLENNAFFLRWPEEERSVFGDAKDGLRLAAYNERYEVELPNIVADPRLAIFQSQQQGDADALFEDRMVGQFEDFPDLFTTNPTLIERGIGLIPDAFADFHFQAVE